MRIRLASTSLVETVVTLGAAVLMTLAGLAMIEDLVSVQTSAATVATHVVATPAPG